MILGEPVNVLRINRENLRHRLSKDLRIEDAQIGYELPLTMVVRVVERKAIAVIPAQFGYLTLDKNGQVIASDSVIEDTTVPMISGVKGGNILLGDMVTDKPIVQALDYLRALDDDTFKQIAEINIGDPNNNDGVYRIRYTDSTRRWRRFEKQSRFNSVYAKRFT